MARRTRRQICSIPARISTTPTNARTGNSFHSPSIEPKFYALLREKLGLTEDVRFDAQLDSEQWVPLKKSLTTLFRTRLAPDGAIFWK